MPRKALRTEPTLTARRSDTGDSPKTKPAPKTSDHPKYRFSFIKPFLDKYVIKESLLFIRQIWNSLRLRFDLAGEYGTEDPALTGMISAGISALSGANGNLRLQSNFEYPTLNLQGELRGRIVPALLIWECGRFIFRPPIRRIWWPMLTKKIRRNEGGV